MRYFISPLRYPGGKERLAPFLGAVVKAQRPRVRIYAEPFAGGCGAGLSLLFDELVDSIVINDLNPGIAAFWRCVVNDTSNFADLVESCHPTIDEWHRQRDVYQQHEADDFALGFATFFLNRTNRSGILGARPIGGLEQTGKWKINARYNASRLADRIRLIGSYRHRIRVEQLDARVLIKQLEGDGSSSIMYVDPPYIEQGGELYMNSLDWDDHVQLAETLENVSTPWILTYDCDDRVIYDLYSRRRCGIFEISHTATTQRFGQEYFVVADNVTVGGLQGFGPRSASWL